MKLYFKGDQYYPMERRSFDVIGDIAVIKSYAKKQEKALVKKILTVSPRIKIILREQGDVKGRYRLYQYKIVFEDTKKIKESKLKKTETIHKEFGCLYKLDVKKAFFNPREATIRNTLANKVKRGERVLVMFSGIAPYPILIAKKVNCHVTGVEMNPVAVQYAVENIRMNKVQERVELFQGDVQDFKPQKKFDRIIMPLGTMAYKYLDSAFKLCKKGGIIHIYGLGEKGRLYEDIERKIEKAAKKGKRKTKIVGRRIILSYSPGVQKVCVDFKVT